MTGKVNFLTQNVGPDYFAIYMGILTDSQMWKLTEKSHFCDLCRAVISNDI